MTFAEFVRSFANEWWRITLLGEPLMLAPVSLIIAVWLWLSCAARPALAWVGLFALGGALLSAQKLLYYVGGVSLASIRLYTVSGHSMTASYVYGSLIVVIARDWRRWLRFAAWAATAAVVLAIGVSRVAVAGHRVSEAVTGLALGTLLLAVFIRYVWPGLRPRHSAWTLALPCLIAMVLTYGHVFEVENIFRWIGRWANPGQRFYR